jgi:hypothetical protein
VSVTCTFELAIPETYDGEELDVGFEPLDFSLWKTITLPDLSFSQQEELYISAEDDDFRFDIGCHVEYVVPRLTSSELVYDVRLEPRESAFRDLDYADLPFSGWSGTWKLFIGKLQNQGWSLSHSLNGDRENKSASIERR